MEYHSLYGPSVPEKGWVPAPRFILRRERIQRLLARYSPGSLLEIGCGAGTLLHEFSKRGFACEALETSTAALEIARHVNADGVIFHRSPQADWADRFDYLFAFEVLEHIEDDRAALATWHTWLKPGGVMLMSVPSHMRKWTASDIYAGHYRRYERATLIDLIKACGFTIEHCESYGFPLANMVSPLRAHIHARILAARREANQDIRTRNNDMSGVERRAESRFYPLLKSLPGRLMMRLAFLMQKWSLNRNWGDGYLVLARKKPVLTDSD